MARKQLVYVLKYGRGANEERCYSNPKEFKQDTLVKEEGLTLDSKPILKAY